MIRPEDDNIMEIFIITKASASTFRKNEFRIFDFTISILYDFITHFMNLQAKKTVFVVVVGAVVAKIVFWYQQW